MRQSTFRFLRLPIMPALIVIGGATAGAPLRDRSSNTVTEVANAGGEGVGSECCVCDYPGDPNTDGKVNLIDILAIIDRAFMNGTCTRDRCCDAERCNFNGVGFTDVMDVVGAINYVFAAGSPPCNPCRTGCPPR